MKILDAKAAVNKEWEKLESCQGGHSGSTKKEQRTVHFATLMDICHLKKPVRTKNTKSTKDESLLRGDIVKDDSGSYAVFTEQVSSASQMTAAKVMDVIARLPDRDGQAVDAVFAYTQSQTGRRSKIAQSSDVRVSRKMDKSSTTQTANILVKHWRSSGSSWTKFVRTPTCWPHVGRTAAGRKRKTLSIRSSVVHLWRQWSGDQNYYQRQTSDCETRVPDPQSRVWLVVWQDQFGPKIQIRYVDTKNQLADMLTKGSFSRDEWGHLFRLLNIMKFLIISVGATQKLLGLEKSHAKTVAWSYDVEGHAKKCVWKDLANWPLKQLSKLHKVATPCMDDHQF